MDVREKIHRKTLAWDVFDRRWSLDGVKTLIKISCKIFNFLDSLQWGGHCVVDHNQNTRVSDASHATTVTFSVKCFNLLKLYPLSGNIFRKWFALYFLFIHEHLIIMWSPTVNMIDWLIDWLIDRSIDGLIDWSID